MTGFLANKGSVLGFNPTASLLHISATWYATHVLVRKPKHLPAKPLRASSSTRCHMYPTCEISHKPLLGSFVWS